MPPIEALDLSRLKVFPLDQRKSLTRAEEILLDPDAAPAAVSEKNAAAIRETAAEVRSARERGAAVMLIYGAHLLRNGAALVLDRMMAEGFITHVATNGAGTIHDWEYAWFGASTESVEMGVAGGHFGAWHETATTIHLALMTGALDGLGYGRALGRLIAEDGAVVPSADDLENAIADEPC
ncbi:MAG TPA: hypothetical protein VNC50_20205, partial [Planctomycetia bacterium]|nr:hypothetical protein [Planctomycetia bacterium]